ncbi:MAG: nitronate monooxygenase [Pseudomonadota bacterium]
MSSGASLSTRFTDAYGLRHPFACAGLAFAGMTPNLALAVSAAGGVGAVGMGMFPAEYVGSVTETIRAASDTPFNINFITIFTDESHIEACERHQPPVVSFHWGHPPRAWIQRLQRAGIRVWEQVGSLEAAQRAVDDNIDLLVLQGTEAGGHNFGTLPLSVLIPEITSEFSDTIVLAAGGIADGRGVASALALGADGVWVGTRMAATEESDIADAYKQRLTSATGADTALSSIFGRDVEGFNPMRVIRNEIVSQWQDKQEQAPSDPSEQEVIGSMDILGNTFPLHKFSNLVPVRGATGDLEQMPLLAGQGVGLVTDIEPAAKAIETMMDEACAIVAKLHKSLHSYA